MHFEEMQKYIKNIFINEFKYNQPYIAIKILNQQKKKEKILRDIENLKIYSQINNKVLKYIAFFNSNNKKLEIDEWTKRKKFSFIENIFNSDLLAIDLNGSYKFSNLLPLNNAYIFFERLYYYLYTNSNINRAEVLAEELIKILSCKIYDEKKNKSNLQFRIIKENSLDNIKNLYKEIKKEYSNVFQDDEIKLNDKSLKFVVEKLQNYSVLKSKGDIIADIFQAILGTSIRGDKGQFFTPNPVVELAVKPLEKFIGNNKRIIDPACGTSSFLKAIINILKKQDGYVKGENIVGFDIDALAVKFSKMMFAILDIQPINIYQIDSLDLPMNWNKKISLETFDLLFTNPPFGAKIPIKDKNKLSQYILARKWNKKKLEFTEELSDSQVPQILFIERSLQLLKDDGIMAIVLPETLFASPQYKYVSKFLLENTKILAVISLPEETFLPSTHTKTLLIFIQKRKEKKSYPVFMGIVNYVGHDRQGKHIEKNDIPIMIEKLKEFFENNNIKETNSNIFIKNSTELRDFILIPEFYRKDIQRNIFIKNNKGKFDFITLGELFDKEIVLKSKGNEIGSKYYDTGDIPFIRTSDISDWFITLFPTKKVSEEVYLKYKTKQDIKNGDILFIADGTYLVGRTAFITSLDTKIIIQSHFYKFRVKDNNFLNKYLFFYLLNSKFVKEQIKDFTITQATISSITPNLSKIVIPIPKRKTERDDISKVIQERILIHEKEKRKMLEILNKLKKF